MASITRRILFNSSNLNIISDVFKLKSYKICLRQMHLLRNQYSAAIRVPTCLSSLSMCKTQSAVVYTSIREKSNKKNRGIRPPESDDEDEDDEAGMNEFKEGNKSDRHLSQIKVQTLRLDAVIKAGLGFSKSKIEKLFYDSKIRIDGKKITKKSIDIVHPCEIDVIKGPSPENSDFLLIGRIEILSIKADGLYFVLTVRRNKNLTVENYDGSSQHTE